MTNVPEENQFYLKLKALNRVRLSIEQVRIAFSEVFPEFTYNPDRISYLYKELGSLRDCGFIEFPSLKNRKAWILESNPRLPAWIVLKVMEGKRETIIAADIPWLSEMRFCVDLKNQQTLADAVIINEFLIRNRRQLIAVPSRERSLQIFGDEKRLDNLIDSGGLFGGKLPLSSLGAFQVEQPLAHQKSGVSGRPILVVENHHTYWSLCEWNSKTVFYSAVVFGAGNAFSATGRAIDALHAEVMGTQIEYIGDLDVLGFEIPLRFNKIRMRDGLLAVKPAVFFYQWLLSNGIRRDTGKGPHYVKPEVTIWLPAGLHPTLSELFFEGKWIPQESLGREQLRNISREDVLIPD